MKPTLMVVLMGVLVSLSAIGASSPAVANDGPAASVAIELASSPTDAGTPWRVLNSDHFQIIYGDDANQASLQARLLETTHDRFFDAFADFGIHRVDEPMVSVFFESKRDYLRYARRVDRVDVSWTVAYYSAKTNRTAFYRFGAPWPTEPGGGSSDDDDNQLFGSATSTTGSTAGDHHHEVTFASATHEAAHQLAFNCGLQRRGVRYPLWVSEGLATNFEATGFDARFGPTFDNPKRRNRLHRLYGYGTLQSLRQFITMTHPPTSDALATDAAYAQAWGLFRFLYQHHYEDLARYLRTLRQLPVGERDARMLLQEFEQHFGPVSRVEERWHEWIATNAGS